MPTSELPLPREMSTFHAMATDPLPGGGQDNGVRLYIPYNSIVAPLPAQAFA